MPAILPSDRIAAAAGKLLNAYRTRTAFDAIESDGPATLEEAYAVQDAVAQALWIDAGDTIRAWKTGGPHAQATPIAAPIPRSRVHASPAALNGRDFQVIGIEAELAYTLRIDLPPQAAPYAERDLAAAIASLHVAIEVCDSRMRNWRTIGALWKLADNQMNGGLIVGEELADWQRIVPEQQVATLEVDGVQCGHSVGAHPYANPLRLLPWLANHCAARCGGLRAGDVVTTGAWTGMHFVEPGATVVARFPGVGEASVRFSR